MLDSRARAGRRCRVHVRHVARAAGERVPRPDRGTAFGLWGATTGAAVAIGPVVGGALTQAIGWEFIFFVDVPIGIGAIALTLAKVDESHAPAGGRIDWAGLVMFSGGLFCLIFALIRGNAEGWSWG